MGVNKRFNKVARSIISNSTIKLAKGSSTGCICGLTKSELDRFCSYILPQMYRDIKLMVLESLSMERILVSADYPNLCVLGLAKLDYKMFSNYLSGILLE